MKKAEAMINDPCGINLKKCFHCASEDVDSGAVLGMVNDECYHATGCMTCGATGPTASNRVDGARLWNLRSLADLQEATGSWAEATFPNSTPESVIAHLGEEVAEFAESLEPEEAADCLLLLCHFAYKRNFNLLSGMINTGSVEFTGNDFSGWLKEYHRRLAGETSGHVQVVSMIAHLMAVAIIQHLALRSIDIYPVAVAKLHKNMQRTWETEPNEGGYFKHKSEPKPPPGEQWDWPRDGDGRAVEDQADG